MVRGYLLAWDPVAQKEVWKVEHPGPWNGGMLSTAGGLVFQGNAAGQFNAYNASTGATLWSFPAQAGVIAAPVTYKSAASSTSRSSSAGAASIRSRPAKPRVKSGPTYNKSRVLAFSSVARRSCRGTAAARSAGRSAGPHRRCRGQHPGDGGYHNYCSVCHGNSAVMAGGVLPDLRWSKSVGSAEAWNKVVIGGSLDSQGMVSFAKVLPPDHAEAIRAYVISRANDTYPGAPR